MLATRAEVDAKEVAAAAEGCAGKNPPHLGWWWAGVGVEASDSPLSVNQV